MAKGTKKQPHLSDQLRTAIDDSGLTIYRIAKDSGVEPTALMRFYHGERDIRLGSAEKVAARLGLHLAKRDKDS